MESESSDVTLVIPGRNSAGTLDECLRAVEPLRKQGHLREIIFVDDRSTDATAQIAGLYDVRVITGEGNGAAAARNLGWWAAETCFIWFIDADCVAEPDALDHLLRHADDPMTGGVGGSYANLRPDSLVASLIHEEIIDRHERMPREVNVLATFNVLYRREALEKVGGFDPACFWAHDAELAYRVCKAGYRLRFEPQSRVGHYHPTALFPYLAKQRKQGFYRMWLYHRHPERMSGDSYSGLTDFVQPPLAVLILLGCLAACLGCTWWPILWTIPLLLAILLVLVQLPMTLRMVLRTSSCRYFCFTPLGFLRAFWRGIGMTSALATLTLRWGICSRDGKQDRNDKNHE